MTLENKSQTIKRDLIRAYAAFDAWFDKDEAFHQYKPPGHTDVVHGIFENVTRFSNLVMDTASGQSIDLHAAAVESDNEFCIEDSIKSILDDFYTSENVFKGKKTNEIRTGFRDSLDQCLCHLELASIGHRFRYSSEFDGSEVGCDLERRIYLIGHYIKEQLNQLNTIEQLYRTQCG